MTDVSSRLGALQPAPDRPAKGRIERLYAQHWSELVRFVMKRYGPGPPEPEDVAQAAFGHFAALAEPDGIDNPRAFLFQTARNYVIDQRRRLSVRKRFAEGPDAHRLTEGVHELGAERVLGAREQLRIVEAAIMAMPQRQREFFILSRFEELSFAEIGRRKGVSEAVVRRIVARGVRDCGRALRKAEGEEEAASSSVPEGPR